MTGVAETGAQGSGCSSVSRGMKKTLTAIAALVLSTVGVGFTAAAAHADPTITECHSISVTVNGDNVVNEAACNTLPPQ